MIGFLEIFFKKREKDPRTDEELFLSYKKGNENDGCMLFADWMTKIRGWVSKKIGRRNTADCDDVIQDVITKIIDLKNKFNSSSPGSFGAWVWKLTSNSYKSALDRKFSYKFTQTENPLDLELASVSFSSDIDDIIDGIKKEESLDIKQMKIVMNLLPEKQKRALNIYFTTNIPKNQAFKEIKLPESSFWYCVEEGKKNCRFLWEMVRETISEKEIAENKKITFLTMEETAKKLSCEKHYVLNEIRKNRLQAYKFRDKFWKIRPEWIKNYLKYYGKNYRCVPHRKALIGAK